MAYYFEYDFEGKDRIDEYAKSAVDLITDWQKADGTTVLEGHLEPEELLIVDTRFGKRSDYRLRGLERELYLYCDEARSLNSIINNLPRHSAESIQHILDLFMANRLMASEGNSYLSLAVLHGEALPKVELMPKQLTVLG
jgi:hypothetical protein